MPQRPFPGDGWFRELGLISCSVFVVFFAAPMVSAQTSAQSKTQPSKTAPLNRAVKPMQAQSPSSINVTTAANGTQTIEINNVGYKIVSAPASGPNANRLLTIRETVHSKEVIGDEGVDATVTVEAWPLGTSLAQKPIYQVSETGESVQIIDGALFVVDRQLEEVAWWSVHKLGNGQRLFDTYVPLVSFSIARDTLTTRYVGLEVPPDDAPGDKKDKRLTEPHVVAVVSYASEDRVIREALLTCDDPNRAALLRSYADSSRTLADIEIPPDTSRDKNAKSKHTLKLTITQDYPFPPNPVEILIPIAGDDLDLPNAKLPARLHLAAWKR